MSSKPGTFQPGQSGNPKGRPKKGYSIREHLRGLMGEEITIPGKDGKPDTIMPKGAFLSTKLFQLAASGDLAAIKMCLDNVDGPPAQAMELSGPGGAELKPSRITVVTTQAASVD